MLVLDIFPHIHHRYHCQRSRRLPSGGYPLFRLHTSALSVSLNQVREKSLFPVYIVERCLGQKPGITPASRHNISRVHVAGFAPIFPDTCYHLTHYWPAAVDIPVASDNPVHYADAIRYNARTPLQGSLLPLTRLV